MLNVETVATFFVKENRYEHVILKAWGNTSSYFVLK